MNRILLSTGSLYNYGLSRVFELAKKAGFEGLELVLGNSWDDLQPGYVKKLIDQYQLPVFSTHAMMDFVNFFGDDFVARTEKSLQITEELGVEKMVLHPSYANRPEYFVWLMKELPKLQEDFSGILILIENLPKVKSRKMPGKMVFEVFSLPEIRRFKNVCLDTSHLATAEIDLLEAWRRLNGRTKQIHLSDAKLKENNAEKGEKYMEHLIPGKGILPLEELLKQMREDNFAGDIVIEMDPINVGAGDEDKIVIKNLREGLDFIKICLKEI